MPQIVNKSLITFNPNITKDRIEGNQFIITDGSNIIPTYNGYSTGLGVESLFYLPISDNELLKSVELQDQGGFLVITKKVMLKYDSTTGESFVLTDFASEAVNVSVAYIGTYYYILVDGTLFKYDEINDIIISEAVEGFPSNANFICATNNRLTALSDDVFAWSAVGDGSDFTSSLETGAGFQSLDSLSTGKGVALAKKSNGLLIFTTTNVVAVTELSTYLVYNFKEISSNKLLNAYCVVPSADGSVYFIDSNKNLYSYTNVTALGTGGFSTVNDILVDYFKRINAQITSIDLVDSRYLIVNYNNNIMGVDLLFGRLFKVKHNVNAVGFYFIEQNYMKHFSYSDIADITFNEISYYGNQLSVGSVETTDGYLMVASFNIYAELPVSNSPVQHTIDRAVNSETLVDAFIPSVFYEDLMSSTYEKDLEDEDGYYIDFAEIDNAFHTHFELLAEIELHSFSSAIKIEPVKGFMEFGTLHFSPEIPIDTTTVITNIDTNMTSNKETSVFLCDATDKSALILDCSSVGTPSYFINKVSESIYEVDLTITSSTDAYGMKSHHVALVEDKYFVGKRMKANVYTTGIYHTLMYNFEGFCEITGLQINLFKGGKIYDR